MEVREKKYHCTLINPSAKGVVTNSVRTCPYSVASLSGYLQMFFVDQRSKIGRHEIKNKKTLLRKCKVV